MIRQRLRVRYGVILAYLLSFGIGFTLLRVFGAPVWYCMLIGLLGCFVTFAVYGDH